MDLLSELANVVPEDRIRADAEEIERHGQPFFTYHAPHPPDVVVFPESRDEVVEILRFANEHGVPVVPYGEGSSLEGHTIPKEGASAWTRAGWTRFSRFAPRTSSLAYNQA